MPSSKKLSDQLLQAVVPFCQYFPFHQKKSGFGVKLHTIPLCQPNFTEKYVILNISMIPHEDFTLIFAGINKVFLEPTKKDMCSSPLSSTKNI